jgi:hypothetical protein
MTSFQRVSFELPQLPPFNKDEETRLRLSASRNHRTPPHHPPTTADSSGAVSIFNSLHCIAPSSRWSLWTNLNLTSKDPLSLHPLLTSLSLSPISPQAPWHHRETPHRLLLWSRELFVTGTRPRGDAPRSLLSLRKKQQLALPLPPLDNGSLLLSELG